MEVLEYLKRQASKGGKKRAEALSPQKRKAIARKAAAASAKVRSAAAKMKAKAKKDKPK